MKYLLILSCLFVAIETNAQLTPQADVFQVVDTKWTMLNTRFVAPSMLNTDPFEPMQRTQQLIYDQKNNIEQNKLREKLGRPQEAPRVRMTSPISNNVSFAQAAYMYQLKLKNVGTKAIKSVTWEFVSVDPATKLEVGRLKLSSETVIKPAETKSLNARSVSPPTATIDVNVLGTKNATKHLEHVEIKKVLFADGTVWTPVAK